MNEIQKKCFAILVEIDNVCKKANLQYFLYAGSLLGAVRHGGFIPWDDDIDVVMMRKDYDKFVAACDMYLNKDRYELQTIHTDPFASNPWMKLHDKNTAFISGVRRNGAMEGINIDIFPVDNAPDSDWVLRKRAKYFDRMNLIYQFRFQQFFRESLKLRIFKRIIALIPPLDEAKFKDKYDKKIQKFNNLETERVVYFSNRKYLRKVIDKRVFDEVEMMMFEGQEFPVPSGWREVLEKLYGNNYMKLPPQEQRVTIHGTLVIDLENSWKCYKRGEDKYEKI